MTRLALGQVECQTRQDGRVDLDAFRWLLTPEGQAVLRRATEAEELNGRSGQMRTATMLRAETTPERVAAAMTQAVLRHRAEPKFGALAASMYFTSDGLEQATRLRVAEHRAARVAAAGPVGVLDLGCGIGGDLMALSRAGLTAAGIDLDELRIAVAAANLDALGLGGAVRVADATTIDLDGFGMVFADPARRNRTGRVFDIDSYEPPWSFVLSLFSRRACVKVAPGIPHSVLPEGVEAEWVSDRGEVKEAALWSVPLATVRRRATVIRPTGLATLTDQHDPGPVPPGPVRRFLYEPDGAVIRAGLVTAVAVRVDGHLLDEHIAYVTSERLVSTPFARTYEVLEILPYREKALRAALRERDIGRLAIKKRGVNVVPEELRKRLVLRGNEEATVVLTRVGGKGIALLVQPLG